MAAGTSVLDSKMAAGPGRIGVLIGVVVLLVGLVYIATHLLKDLSGIQAQSWLPTRYSASLSSPPSLSNS